MSLSLEDFLEWEILISLKMFLTNTGVKLHCLEPCIFFFTFLMFSNVSIVHFEQVKSGSFLPYVTGPQQWSKSSYALGPAHLSFLQFFSSSNFQSGSFPWISQLVFFETQNNVSVLYGGLHYRTKFFVKISFEQKYQKWSKIVPKWDF